MTLDILWYNMGVPLGGFLLFSLVALAVVKALFSVKISKSVYKLWALVFILFVWWTVTATHGPRVVITDSTPPAPIFDGTVTSKAPPKMTNEERLQYNRALNEENRIPDNRK